MAGERFEIFKDSVGKFRFRLRAQNGEIIAESQGYGSKDGCQKGIASVKGKCFQSRNKRLHNLETDNSVFWRRREVV